MSNYPPTEYDGGSEAPHPSLDKDTLHLYL